VLTEVEREILDLLEMGGETVDLLWQMLPPDHQELLREPAALSRCLDRLLALHLIEFHDDSYGGKRWWTLAKQTGEASE